MYLSYNFSLHGMSTEQQSQIEKMRKVPAVQEFEMEHLWIQASDTLPLQIKKTRTICMLKDMENRARTVKQSGQDYYEFYHAVGNSQFIVLQELYKRLWEGKQKKLLNNFWFFRYSPDDISDNHKGKALHNIETFLEYFIKKDGIIDDTEGKPRDYLLCVNFSPFGNFHVRGESTFNYFWTASNASTPPNLCKKIL